MSFELLTDNPNDLPESNNPCGEGSGVTDITKTLRKIDSAPSFHNSSSERTFRQVPVDLVEEESMESFPASDPPGHHKANA